MALSWIDVYGDIDGDGFVEATARAGHPRQHSWKSSPLATTFTPIDRRLA